MKGVRTPFDFTAAVDGQAIFFDAKATAGTRFNIRSYILAPKKIHQYHALCDARLMGKAHAGYLIWFYEQKKIVWAPIQVVQTMVQHLTGERAITPDTPGCVVQDDFIQIHLDKIIASVASRQAP